MSKCPARALQLFSFFSELSDSVVAAEERWADAGSQLVPCTPHYHTERARHLMRNTACAAGCPALAAVHASCHAGLRLGISALDKRGVSNVARMETRFSSTSPVSRQLTSSVSQTCAREWEIYSICQRVSTNLKHVFVSVAEDFSVCECASPQ